MEEDKNKEIMTPEKFMHDHNIGMNICYWMLVTMKEKELRNIQEAMLAYAKYYHEEKING